MTPNWHCVNIGIQVTLHRGFDRVHPTQLLESSNARGARRGLGLLVGATLFIDACQVARAA
jgi:hypothetical protein